jgi:DNA-binding transcriptional MerR regulator/methylmalonyl-CoA mutase cobalamin-binding subunit
MMTMDDGILYPVKAVTMRTGLSPHALRAWERRYQVVAPRRSGSNRRLYSEAEVERLTLLKRAVDAGHAIGQICSLPEEVLIRLSNQPARPGSRADVPAEIQDAGAARELLSRARAAVRTMDGTALESTLQQAAVQLSRPVLVEELLLPLVQFVGDSWQSGELRIAHEHVATGVIRIFLHGLIHRERIPEGAPQLVVATVSGQVHELGALLAAAIAVSHGWKVSYLGADLPAEEIAAVIASTRARAVALSFVYPAGDPAVAEEIRRLRVCMPDEVALIIGGRASASYLPIVDASGIIHLEKISSLPGKLAALA